MFGRRAIEALGTPPVTFPPLQPPTPSHVCPSKTGYPVGGDSLSITKGIVSRVCMTRYSQAARLASLQIDAVR